MLAAAGSWLDARAAGGEWLLRIEDIDPPREVPGAADDIIRVLDAFGLWWDGEVLFQSQRREAHDAALQRLLSVGWAYPCACTRKSIAEANRRRGRPGDTSYPGTCRGLQRSAAKRSQVVRVLTTAEPVQALDRLQGAFTQVLEEEPGDFVLRRRDGLIAYQLAVVVDDHDQGITDVVRGVDLFDSTPRQQWLQRLLAYPAPRYMHLPTVILADGAKLSKQTGAPPVAAAVPGIVAWQVLACLGQSPPAELRGAPPVETWQWGIRHWQPQHIAGIRNIPMP